MYNLIAQSKTNNFCKNNQLGPTMYEMEVSRNKVLALLDMGMGYAEITCLVPSS